MSKLNYGFVNHCVRADLEIANKYVFAIADVRNQIVSKRRLFMKQVTELEKSRDQSLANGNTENASKVSTMIENTMKMVSEIDEKLSALNLKRSELLFGVHTKSINIDGVIDRINLSSLYDDYCEYRDGVTNRQDYINAIKTALETWGMNAPEKLFLNAARRIADSVGVVKTSDRQAVKGQLVKNTAKLAFYEIVIRVIITEMRSKVAYPDYTSDGYKAHVAWGIVNNKVSALNVWVEHK